MVQNRQVSHFLLTWGGNTGASPLSILSIKLIFAIRNGLLAGLGSIERNIACCSSRSLIESIPFLTSAFTDAISSTSLISSGVANPSTYDSRMPEFIYLLMSFILHIALLWFFFSNPAFKAKVQKNFVP